jgi:hypothetical protein
MDPINLMEDVKELYAPKKDNKQLAIKFKHQYYLKVQKARDFVAF